MNAANRRSALAALDAGRPTIARLDIARDPEDIAADLIEGWGAAETALRSLVGGSALAGQTLIRELRQRELLSLDEAHVLLEFLAARDRVERTSYRPTSTDVAAARDGFQKLEARLASLSDAELSRHAAAPAAAVPATAARGEPLPPASHVPAPAPHGASHGPAVAILLTLLAAIGLAAGGYWLVTRSQAPDVPASVARGEEHYRAGRREAAKGEFQKAARDNPRLALPHVYLARIAREEGDAATAGRELQTAITLEPDNAVAQREMGSHLLAIGNPELASRFYRRAVEINPRDSVAQGYLGCAMARLGRVDLAQRFLARAGDGPWRTCVSAAAPPATARAP